MHAGKQSNTLPLYELKDLIARINVIYIFSNCCIVGQLSGSFTSDLG